MYIMYAQSKLRPTAHIYSGWGGLNRTYESELRHYLVFEEDEMIAFTYGVYLRTPPIGNWEYAPFGDVDWSEWDDAEGKKDWHEEAFKVARPASEMEAEFKSLLDQGYVLYCKI